MMKALLLSLSLVIGLVYATPSSAEVVRSSPDFKFAGAKKTTLRSLKGQPVVLLMADKAKNRKLRKQLDRMQKIYQQFASRGVVVAAALQNEEGQIPTNIPVVILENGASVAANYGMEGDFRLIVIGRDGNQDLVTDKVVAGTRVREVIQNSFEVQKVLRREVPRKY